MLRKVILTASTVLFAAAGTAIAQDAVVIEENTRAWRVVPQGETFAQGDCVELPPEEAMHSQPPALMDGQTVCPPGMVPYGSLITGSTSSEGGTEAGSVADDPGTGGDGGTDDGGTDDGADDGGADDGGADGGADDGGAADGGVE